MFPSPTRLVADVVASVGGFARDDDPWSTRRLTWPLLEVIGLSLDEPWCLTLRRHLLDAEGVDQGRRVQVALHLAGLAPAPELDEALRPKWLFGRTVRESCMSNSGSPNNAAQASAASTAAKVGGATASSRR